MRVTTRAVLATTVVLSLLAATAPGGTAWAQGDPPPLEYDNGGGGSGGGVNCNNGCQSCMPDGEGGALCAFAQGNGLCTCMEYYIFGQNYCGLSGQPCDGTVVRG